MSDGEHAVMFDSCSENGDSASDDEFPINERNGSDPAELHSALKADVGNARKTFRIIEEEFGMPSVEIEDDKMSWLCSVRMTFSCLCLPENLRRLWELEDVSCFSIIVQGVHRTYFRRFEKLPMVTARKSMQDHSKFIAGEHLSNLTKIILERIYHVHDEKDMELSFFEILYSELSERLKCLSEFCMICCDKLDIGGILPAVCEKDLCSYQYSELHLMDGLVTPRVSPQVLDLLLLFFSAANSSPRRDLILTPPPNQQYKDDLRSELHRECADRHQLAETVADSILYEIVRKRIPCPAEMLKTPSQYGVFRKTSPQLANFVEWLVISNRAYLESVPSKLRVDFLGTGMQYLFVADSPAKQKEFDELVTASGGNTKYFFHGSSLENWHSIIRSGLKNMSNKPGYMTTGAAYGPGIYLSPLLDTSAGYARAIAMPAAARGTCSRDCCPATDIAHAVALVEVVDTPAAFSNRSNSNIVVVPEEKYCCIRMLLLYTNAAEMRGIDLQGMTAAQKAAINLVVKRFKSASSKERAEFC